MLDRLGRSMVVRLPADYDAKSKSTVIVRARLRVAAVDDVPYNTAMCLKPWPESLGCSMLERFSVDNGLMPKPRTVWLRLQVAGADGVPYNTARCLRSWLDRLGCSMLERLSVDYGMPTG